MSDSALVQEMTALLRLPRLSPGTRALVERAIQEQRQYDGSSVTIHTRSMGSRWEATAPSSSLPFMTADSPLKAARQLAWKLMGDDFRLEFVRTGEWLASPRRKTPATAGAISTPLACALAALFVVPFIIAAVGYCLVWWDYRYLLSPRTTPHAGPDSAPRVEAGASNNSPRTDALPARAAFRKEESCTNK